MTQEEFNILVEKNQPHPVFKTDWHVFYSLDFADTLLPDVPLYQGKAMYMFDGAGFFNTLQKTTRRTLSIEGDGKLINLIGYTYPKGVQAGEVKSNVQPADFEVCVFAEAAQDDSIEISFKFGKRFKEYLKNTANTFNTEQLENKGYPTTIADFKAFFGNRLVHEDLMRYVLETIGVDFEAENSALSKLIMFFRSKKQAEGFPKETMVDTNDGRKVPKIIIDDEYDGSYGFDVFSTKLYGRNTVIYSEVEDEIRNVKMVNSGRTIENTYQEDETLSLELKNAKNKSFFINTNFEITENTNHKNYYIPNLLVKRGKEIQVFLKYFNVDNNKGTDITITLSGKKGIEHITPSLSFPNTRRNILPITIKTSRNDFIEERITVYASCKENGKELITGKLNLLPNIEINPKFIFVDVNFTNNDNVELLSANNHQDYVKLTEELNKKAFNQSGINIDYCNTKLLNIGYLCPTINNNGRKSNNETIRSLIDPNNYAKNLDRILRTLKHYFYEQIALSIFLEIEQELSKIKFTLNGEEVPLIPVGKTLKELINEDTSDMFDRVVNHLVDYLSKEMKLNLFAGFMCRDIKTDGSTTAVGTIGGTGLIVPEILEQNDKKTNNFKSTMLIAHEIGHNFGLHHPFDNHEGDGDLKLKQRQTLENIMDYLPDAENTCKSFITYQWEKMRDYLNSNKNEVGELDFKPYSVPYNWRHLKDFSNNHKHDALSEFCKNSLEGILGNRRLEYKDNIPLYTEISSIFENEKFQDNIIDYFIKSIINQINKLCGI